MTERAAVARPWRDADRRYVNTSGRKEKASPVDLPPAELDTIQDAPKSQRVAQER